MQSFFDLVGFEYKKLFKRRSTIISLVMVLAIAVITCITSITGHVYWSSGERIPLLEAMRQDREVITSKAGYMEEAFIREAIEQNAIMIANNDNYIINDYGKHLKSSAYMNYILPYEKAVNIINIIYERNIENLGTNGIELFNTSTIRPIDKLRTEDAAGFYEVINQTVQNQINGRTLLSEGEKTKHFEMLSRVETPYYNDYFQGFLTFARLLQVVALIMMIAMAISISPIFSNEYQTKMDQLLLTSKYGKSKAIAAKLFTGFSFTLALAMITLFGLLLSLQVLHGFRGADVAIQAMDVFSTYPLTMLQASLIAILVVISTTLLFVICIMLFSAWIKSAFLVVTMSFLLLFMPGLINISAKNRLLYQLLQLFPAKATMFSNIFSEYFFEIPGIILTPPVFYVIFSILMASLLTPITGYVFKSHQVE